MTNLKILSIVGILEGISYLLLFGVGMPLKYMWEMPMANLVIGTLHGVLFIAYCIWVFVVAGEKEWPKITTFWALVASLLPFGTFVADKKLFKE
ncbi:MAG: DUF3817 domain-containing protein [Aureispira sp.]|nr:DUF3817 domain-containing protein [Aureispira sp.]